MQEYAMTVMMGAGCILLVVGNVHELANHCCRLQSRLTRKHITRRERGANYFVANVVGYCSIYCYVNYGVL